MLHAPGLARMALAAPAIAPARAISLRDRGGNGDINRFEIPYDANSNELTPAIPMSGEAIPNFRGYSRSRSSI